MIDLDGDSDYPRRKSRSRFPLLLLALAACLLLAWYDSDLAIVLAAVIVAGYVLHAIAVWLADTGLFLHVLVVVAGVLAIVWMFVPDAFDPESALRRHMPGPVRRLEQRMGLRPPPSTLPNPDAVPTSGTSPSQPSTPGATTPRTQPSAGSSPARASDLRRASLDEEPARPPRIATTVALSATPAQGAEGEEIRLVAVVTAKPEAGEISGTVRFETASGTVLGESPLTAARGSASATLVTTLPAAETMIRAVYSGSGRLLESTSPAVRVMEPGLFRMGMS